MIYESLKLILPQLVDEGIRQEVKKQGIHLDWIVIIESDQQVRNYIERLVEIDQIRLLKSSFGQQVPVGMYKDYFRAVSTVVAFKNWSMFAVLKEYKNVIDDKA
jgi:hypothetical protein